MSRAGGIVLAWSAISIQQLCRHELKFALLAICWDCVCTDPCTRCEKVTCSQWQSFVHIPNLLLLNIDDHFMLAKCWNHFHKARQPNKGMSLVIHPILTQGHPPELPEELVPRRLCVIYPGGLHLPDGRQSGLWGLQDSQGVAHRPLHQNPEPASAAAPVQTHPLHPPVGGGENQRTGNSCCKERADLMGRKYLWNWDSTIVI